MAKFLSRCSLLVSCSTLRHSRFSMKMRPASSFSEMSQKIFTNVDKATLSPTHHIPRANEDENSSVDALVQKGQALVEARLAEGAKLKPIALRNFRGILERHPRSYRNNWLKIFLARPELFLVSAELFPNLEALIDFLIVKLELSKRASFSLLAALPAEFIYHQRSSRDELFSRWHASLGNWFGLCKQFDLSTTDAVSSLILIPEILFINPDLWCERLDQLRNEYLLDKKTLKKFLQNAGSSILLEDWKTLSKKLDFFFKEMQVDKIDLANNAPVILYDLDHIMTRYQFLNRAGLYKHPSAKALGTSRSASPMIDKVVFESDEDFLEKVAGPCFTPEDYECFQQILKSEKVFESREERENFSVEGYEDVSFREDLEEMKTFQSLYDRSKLREDD